MASVSQTNDTLTNVQVSYSSCFRSQKQGWKIVKLGSRLWSTSWSTKPERDNSEEMSNGNFNYYACSKICQP